MSSKRVSVASAPSLPFTLDSIPGYENTSGLNEVFMVPPPSPLDYILYFPDDPPPPYEEQDSAPGEEDIKAQNNGGLEENGDVASFMENYWFIPGDNQAYNPQWLQRMNSSQTLEYGSDRNLTEDDAIEALSTFVSGNCCYNNGVTKQMRAKEMKSSNGHQYILESYYEERCTAWHHEPYSTQIIDGPGNGSPPAAWEINVTRPRMFHNKEVYVEVPHTASLKDCTCCNGLGNKKCNRCNGVGDIKCSVCDGLGVLHQYINEEVSALERRTSGVGCRACHNCNGGKRVCSHCSGEAHTTCGSCLGSGCVKVFIRLTVKWKTLKACKVVGKTKLPKKYISEVSGTLVFQEQNDRVYPLLDFPEDQINNHSRKMISQHEEQLSHGRIIMQRHCVREVPVTEVRSQWKRQEFTYWVYGNENQVYCPDYPSKCLPGCTIL